jgi:prefoldin alpha subunit
MSLEEREKKIQEYEIFINQKLKVDLQKILNYRDEIYQKISDYLDLRNRIFILQEQKLTKMKTLVNLGSEFYVNAIVEDINYIFVNVGLGFHVQLSFDEALQFIEKKRKNFIKICRRRNKKSFQN